ncbi:hypothetical protein SAMN04490179_5194 [Pseudomonas antarctica]|uniref:Uncharacterized protein n=1 Tax=Pseudomonas antarctica TaxID=219572 RepID=A0A1H0D1F4_9PSED|nr:hypothetical protein PSAN_55080 [Pseudomonas antarctica]SDN64017.1 hypothetical protein SAMN04490179_5194 [Pseudomonas antarctica]
MRALFNAGLCVYKSALQGHRNIIVLVILALAIVVAGFCLWVIRFIATPTARTLLRVFVGLCLAAALAYVVLARGFPIAVLLS